MQTITKDAFPARGQARLCNFTFIEHAQSFTFSRSGVSVPFGTVRPSPG
jgi:hypothetical protein